jgi:hypothetical protein
MYKRASTSCIFVVTASHIIAHDIALAYSHTMRLVHIEPNWSMDTKISHVLMERIADAYLTAWH